MSRIAIDKKIRWDHPCSDCSALLGGKRSLPGAHEYLMLKATGPVVYECLICGTLLDCSDSGTWRELAPESLPGGHSGAHFALLNSLARPAEQRGTG